ncbi:MAG: hypothetical protein EOM14_05535 [Clostridia bacterium]|nr:hypothetical protein [Clostridia bacterium]
MKKLSYLFFAFLLISIISGCGTSNVTTSPDVIPSAEISPDITTSPEVSVAPETDEGTENGGVVESPAASTAQ